MNIYVLIALGASLSGYTRRNTGRPRNRSQHGSCRCSVVTSVRS